MLTKNTQMPIAKSHVMSYNFNMDSKKDEKLNNEQHRQTHIVLCLLSITLILASVLLIGFDWTGSDRENRIHPTPTPGPDFVRNTTPIPLPTPEVPSETLTPVPTPEAYVATTLFVDGNPVCTLASKQAVKLLLESVVEYFEQLCNVPNLKSEILNTIELRDSEDEDLTSFDSAFVFLTANDTPIVVESKHTQTEPEFIDHDVNKTYDYSYYIGTRIVASYGIDGKNCHTVEYTYKNGEQLESREIEAYSLYQAVMERIIIGTRPIPSTDTDSSDFGKTDCPYRNWNLRNPVDLNVSSVVRHFGFYDGVFHPGVDYQCPANTLCKTVRAGTVIAVFKRGAYGLTIDIQHDDGLVTRYAGLSNATVSVGDELSIADGIGYTGESEFHFEMILDGKPRNPEVYLSKNFD